MWVWVGRGRRGEDPPAAAAAALLLPGALPSARRRRALRRLALPLPLRLLAHALLHRRDCARVAAGMAADVGLEEEEGGDAVESHRRRRCRRRGGASTVSIPIPIPIPSTLLLARRALQHLPLLSLRRLHRDDSVGAQRCRGDGGERHAMRGKLLEPRNDLLHPGLGAGAAAKGLAAVVLVRARVVVDVRDEAREALLVRREQGKRARAELPVPVLLLRPLPPVVAAAAPAAAPAAAFVVTLGLQVPPAAARRRPRRRRRRRRGRVLPSLRPVAAVDGVERDEAGVALHAHVVPHAQVEAEVDPPRLEERGAEELADRAGLQPEAVRDLPRPRVLVLDASRDDVSERGLARCRRRQRDGHGVAAWAAAVVRGHDAHAAEEGDASAALLLLLLLLILALVLAVALALALALVGGVGNAEEHSLGPDGEALGDVSRARLLEAGVGRGRRGKRDLQRHPLRLGGEDLEAAAAASVALHPDELLDLDADVDASGGQASLIDAALAVQPRALLLLRLSLPLPPLRGVEGDALHLCHHRVGAVGDKVFLLLAGVGRVLDLGVGGGMRYR